MRMQQFWRGFIPTGSLPGCWIRHRKPPSAKITARTSVAAGPVPITVQGLRPVASCRRISTRWPIPDASGNAPKRLTYAQIGLRAKFLWEDLAKICMVRASLDSVFLGSCILHRNFCLSCLTRLFTKILKLEFMINVRSPIFGDPSWVEPFIETMVSKKQDWVKLTSRHQFPTFPKSDEYEALMKEFSLARDISQ